MPELLRGNRHASKVIYNWAWTALGEECQGAFVGERPQGTVWREAKAIIYHHAQGEGDRHYVDVTWADGRVERLFNLNRVTFLDDAARPAA